MVVHGVTARLEAEGTALKLGLSLRLSEAQGIRVDGLTKFDKTIQNSKVKIAKKQYMRDKSCEHKLQKTVEPQFKTKRLDSFVIDI